MDYLNRVTGEIVDSAVRTHARLGPGLLETVYERVLARDLLRRGYTIHRQMPVSFEMDGMRFENAFRVDLAVEDAVLVEVKCVDRVAGVHRKQVLTYLRLLDYRVGLLLNFGATLMKDGIHRFINQESAEGGRRTRVTRIDRQ